MSNNESSSRAARDRHEQAARDALRDLVEFHEALMKEMETMTTAGAQGAIIDTELLAKMRNVDKLYFAAMAALRESEDEARDAMTMVADSIQDLMRHINMQEEEREGTDHVQGQQPETTV